MELVTQGIMMLIAVGAFVGQTQHALKVFEKRLDKNDDLLVQSIERLTAIETRLETQERR